ncbi:MULTISPECIES: hypothetical protein [unclassified Alcanivorax]|uniref:AbiU2 domain-containing protein n=1 Tax=unclassified Alcanivorax TaxID=2638842 RepID=UPI0023572706|nr:MULTISPECIES: hypothetical protein [unclassified Alcanivorax]
MELSILKQAFQQFRIECIWLRRCYNTHCTLFGGGDEVDELLMSTAGSFFYDLSRVLQEYVLQRICSLTDPPGFGSSKNLSMRFINEGLTEYGLLTNDITEVSGRIEEYRKLVVKARNKGLSHFDLKVSLSGETLGEHSPEEVEQFYVDIQIYNDEVGKVLGFGPLDFQASPAEGDAVDLIAFLRGCANRQQELSG